MQSEGRLSSVVQYWSGLVLVKVLARLPIAVANMFGHIVAASMWAINGRMRQVTEKNLAICFPDSTCEQRRALAKASLFELSTGMIDLARCWVRDGTELEARISRVEGKECLDEAVSAGTGTLLILPHLGSWEIVSLYLSRRYEITALYRQPKTTLFADFVRRKRQRHGATLVPIGTAGLRAVLRSLRSNNMSLLFPDQVPPPKYGKFAPFFGEPTLTMTLASKLLGRSGAKALCAYCKRRSDGNYELVFRPVDERLYDRNCDTALAGLNKSVEACVLECPEQYQWEYKRFRYLPGYRKRDYRSGETHESELPGRHEA